VLSALSAQNDPPEQTSKPFSKNRDGFVLAEGAAALVLESMEHAQARGAKILGIVQGCGEKSDNFHRTRSSPNGRPIIGCMQNAFTDAGISPDDVDYINAHGTSTPENDKMEYTGVAAGFGERAQKIPISFQQVDDRAHRSPRRVRSRRYSRCSPSKTTHSAHDQSQGAGSGDSARRGPQCRARTPRSEPRFPIPSASAARMCAWCLRASRPETSRISRSKRG